MKSHPFPNGSKPSISCIIETVIPEFGEGLSSPLPAAGHFREMPALKWRDSGIPRTCRPDRVPMEFPASDNG